MQEILTEISRLVTKYVSSNAIKKSYIASSTRNKLKSLKFSLTFQMRLFDSVHVQGPPVQVIQENEEGQMVQSIRS